MRLTGHIVNVPIDYSDPERGSIEIFFRIVESVATSKSEKRYHLLFLQGPAAFNALQSIEHLANYDGKSTFAAV